MTETKNAPKDTWDSETYTGKVAPFVPLLTTRVVALLDPQPHDTILDLGCGNGVLTSQLSLLCTHITGLDSSPNMIRTAQSHYSTASTTYHLHDCRRLTPLPTTTQKKFSKVFSNAALHWILRDPGTRAGVFQGAYDALQPGGSFVAELGAHGNVAEVHAALVAALVHRGVAPERARGASPWWFPTEVGVRGLLVGAGFRVQVVETELRQTVLTEGEGGGLEGWVRLFGEAFLGVVEEGSREEVVREVVEVLEGVGRRGVGEGGFTLNYIRLRFVAVKPGVGE